jgi:molecular chaperone HtpG
MSKATVSKRKFKSELSEILNIITHSLYSHTEVFLRELISNASDAIDKVRYEGLNNDSVFEDNKDWKIKLAVDKDAGTVTISDNGIGMDKDAIIEHLGTIAKSGTKAFLESAKDAKSKSLPELIGQFGVGFYSAFMVADKVTVLSRMAGDPSSGVKWQSDGKGEYTVRPEEKETRGTDVILHLKEESKEYLDDYKLRSVVKDYSDFIEYPVVIDVEKETDGEISTEEETLNSQIALWLRDKDEVSEEDHTNFYKQISNDFEAPAKAIHYLGEGFTEFNVLLYIPKQKPFDLQFGDVKFGPRLYIKRVLVMENCEALLPPYLRFVKGVVDCPDLPLNVSREMLQDNPLLGRIKKNLVKNVLKTLAEMKDESYDDYVNWFNQMGEILKEGLAQDFENRETIADLILFESINTERGKFTTLSDYVEAMPEGQNDIYYLTGEHRAHIENAPYLEVFKDKGWDVLLLTDPVDEFILQTFNEYKEHPLKAADKGELESDIEVDDSELKQEFLPLFESLRQTLDAVTEVRLSKRLKNSPSCLVGEEGAMGAHMERIMQQLGKADEIPTPERILELNPEHAVVKALKNIHASNPNDPKVENYGKLLYEQAVIAEGSPLENPSEFVQRINELLLKDTIQT